MEKEYKNNAEYEAAVKRIEKMEKSFDKAQNAGVKLKKALEAYSKALTDIKAISDYYGNEWKRDYAADENGELPPELKRGVLSEDGLWNFFDDSRELAEELKRLGEELRALL